MRAMYTLPASLLLLLLLMLLLLGMDLNEAATVNDDVAAVDKEVAPVGVVKTDLLSLEQEIGGNPAAKRREVLQRQKRYFFYGVGGGVGVGVGIGVGPTWIGGSGGGFGWGYPNNYGYYSSPYYSYGGSGYYPSVFGYKKIIIG